MDILIVYATNSGGTYLAGQYIQDVLQEHGHQVVLKKAKDTTSQELGQYQVVIFGSPSWYVDGREGQMHWDMAKLLDAIPDALLHKKQCAVYGLGDNSYAYFCGAVDAIEIKLAQHNMQIVVPSLRINEFYYQPDANAADIKQWAHKLAGRVSNTPTQGRKKIPSSISETKEPAVIRLSKRLMVSIAFGLLLGVLFEHVVIGLLFGIGVGVLATSKKQDSV